MDARQPHQDGRIVHVVIRHVVHVWLRRDQLVALFERDLHAQRVRLGGLVDRLTGNELAADLEDVAPYEVLSSTPGSASASSRTVSS